ncbi:ABC transporter ATP-binding protein [Halomonas sp. HMF6819]|uniref:ABC transporter ATP-binding protein n=1 Tax=Halomonas sp. HMF6819 TaxID=3373085 RepID=UPI00378BF309
MTPAPFIEIDNLHFSRGDHDIFRGVNLRIPHGQITAIMGPSGTGKTTLLKLIGGQLTPDRGRILIDGQDVHRLSRKALFTLRKRMGMLFQSGALFSDLNVFENVAFPLRVHTDLPDAMIRDLVLMKLQAVGLRGARNLTPAELSGGMARRVALARAIALDPELVLYDEPFVGQDPISMGVLVQLIKRLNEALALTSVVVSHDIKETLSIADYLYLIADGQVVSEGTPDTFDNSEDPRVSQFVHGQPDGPVPFHYPAPGFYSDMLGQSHPKRTG